MATVSFDPGGEPRRRGAATPLDRVAGDMAAIFGTTAPRARPVSAARVLGETGRQRRRSTWGRVGAVLLGGGVAGALLGAWVLATPHDATRSSTAPAAVHVATSAGTTTPVVASAMPVMPPPVAAEPPVRADTSPVLAEPWSAPAEEAAPPPVAYVARPVPAPERPDVVPAPEAPPRLASRRLADDGCARFADACTFADARDADLQLRDAYLAAMDAGADPRDLADVRRRWALFRARDAGRPDLLVTDYARLAGRLAWLADDAAGADGPE